MFQKTEKNKCFFPPKNNVEYDIYIVGMFLCCHVPHLNFSLNSYLLIHTSVINHSIMQCNSLAATGKPFCKQNLSSHIKKKRAWLKKNELKFLDTNESTVPCVLGVYVVSLCELSIPIETETAAASTQYFSELMRIYPKVIKVMGKRSQRTY